MRTVKNRLIDKFRNRNTLLTKRSDFMHRYANPALKKIKNILWAPYQPAAKLKQLFTFEYDVFK